MNVSVSLKRGGSVVCSGCMAAMKNAERALLLPLCLGLAALSEVGHLATTVRLWFGWF
jgi:hypothetical protein